MNHKRFKNLRNNFLNKHKDNDHVVIEGKKKVLISAPHGVSQSRLGKTKVAEIGTIPLSLELQKFTNAFCIIKTKNNFDDANFDEKSSYKDEINFLMEKHNFSHLFDIHGLASKREMDVNLGVNFGNSIKTDTALFDRLVKMLKNSGFKVTIDQPFSGGPKTISGSTKEKYPHVWAVQVEINSKLTNFEENSEKSNKLISVLSDFINSIN